MTIKKDTLHPENEPEVDIYPKTSIDQVENLQANLDALNGDIANVNGEIANISTNDTNQDRRIQVLENTSGTTINRVEIAENNITDLQNDVNQNIIDTSDIKDDITVLNTAYGSYTDYTEVTNGFLLTYLSGKQIELPIKAGTNVTFSKYPGSNQIIINSTGGSVPDNIALLDAANTFTAQNTFNKLTYFKDNVFFQNIPASFEDSTRNLKLLLNYNGFIKSNRDTGNVYNITFPNQTGTVALTTDIPSLADYPTTIFFNNYNAGIGYKDTSTGTTKTVVSTDNNGAQIVLGDSNTGLTLATNARPKVLEDSTVKEVAYVSDIPNTSSFPTLAGNNKWTGDNIFDGFSKSIRVNGLFQVSGDKELISATYNQVSYDGLNIAYMDGENQNIFHVGIDFENKARFGFDKYDGSSYNLYIPEKDGTIALLSDITSGSSQDFSLYSDYEIVDKGFMLTYADGSKFELPIKAGTNVTFSKYPNTNQVVINATGGNGGGDVYTSANNTFTGNNYFNGQVKCANNKGLDIVSGVGTYRFIGLDNDCGITIIKPDLNVYRLVIPDKNGTLSTVEDIPNYNSVAGVSYDTTNGAIISYTNGKLITIPIKAGDGVTIDADKTNQNILISAPGGGSSTPQYNMGMDSATPTTFTFELGVYHTLTITLLSTYVSTTIILPNNYNGSKIDIELGGKSFLIMVVAGLLSVRNTTDNTEWVGKLE